MMKLGDAIYLLLIMGFLWFVFKIWSWMQEYEQRKHDHEQRHTDDELFKGKGRRVSKYMKVGYCKK